MAKVRVQELDVDDYDLTTDPHDQESIKKTTPSNEKSVYSRVEKQDKRSAKNYRNSKRSLKRDAQESYLNDR